METFTAPVQLGTAPFQVGRLGVAGGYGAPAQAFEMAFERGCNYFYHGSRRAAGMNQAIKTLAAAGKRDRLVVVAQAYTRSAWHLKRSFEAFRKKTGLDSVDVLLLGWYNSEPSQKILDVCEDLKQQKLVRSLAISGHNRPAFPRFAASGKFDILHVRYNAAHRGAETDVFPKLPSPRPGIVIYTATRWGNLINPKRTPPGVPVPRASDCYRFVLTNESVNVCMTGPKNLDQMQEALATLDRGPLTPDEMEWMTKVGGHVHQQNPWFNL